MHVLCMNNKRLGKDALFFHSLYLSLSHTQVERFSVSARGKDLLVNADLTVAHGRRYGLVGPNGKGKSTLMKLIAKRRVPIPEHIDVLLVEQEVIGDERTALEAVVSADVKLMKLTEEEARLTKIAQEAEEKGGLSERCKGLCWVTSIELSNW